MTIRDTCANYVEIGGLLFTVKQFEKLAEEMRSDRLPVKTPMANIRKIDYLTNSYRCCVTIFVSSNLDDFEVSSQSLIPLSSSKELVDKLFLKYNGVVEVETGISGNLNIAGSQDSGKPISCRGFEIMYSSHGGTTFDVYYLVFDYSILAKNALQADAIVIRDVNVDPETSRGTVTTSSSSG